MEAKFIKSPNKGESMWKVFDLDKLVLCMTVNEIISGTDFGYDDVVTIEFGKWLIKEVRDYHDV